MTDTMPALVLIGEPNDELARAHGVAARGFVPVRGQPMLAHTLAILRACGGRVVVVGNETLRAPVRELDDIEFIAAPHAVSAKLQAGMAALEHPTRALMCAADSPLASAEGLRAFAHEAAARQLALAYPIVPREVCEAAFPGGRRTYVTMREGTFTGGNFLALSDELVMRRGAWIDRFFAARKSPLKLARMLGAPFVVKLLLGRLTIAETERAFLRRFDLRAAAIVTQDAGMGFDIDKADDLALAERLRP